MLKRTHAVITAAIILSYIPANVGAKTETVSGNTSTPSKDMAKVLNNLSELGGKPIEQCTPLEARRQPTLTDAVIKTLRDAGKGTTLPAPDIQSVVILGPDNTDLKLRIYCPKGKGPFPVVVYFHGGGWVLADLDTYDGSARGISLGAHAVVVSVDYRKGPEAKFPAAHDDCFAAYKWVLNTIQNYKGDVHKVAVAGESAGGNLAISTVLQARNEKTQLPCHQVLIYPVADPDMTKVSYQKNANAKPLNAAMIPWFLKNYFEKPEDATNTRFSVSKADLSGLPSTTVITAEIDPLNSDGRLLAEKLRKAGVDCDYKDYVGATHEFFGTGLVTTNGKLALLKVSKNLRAAFK